MNSMPMPSAGESSSSNPRKKNRSTRSRVPSLDMSSRSNRRVTPTPPQTSEVGSGSFKTLAARAKDYVDRGYYDFSVPTDDELLKVHGLGSSSHPEISYPNLVSAADWLFDKMDPSQGKLSAFTKAFYKDFNLEERGGPSLMLDYALLMKYFGRAYQEVMDPTKSGERTRRVLDIGCGTGRLSILMIELAKKLGLREIVFNDLIEGHVNATRKKIKDTYGDRANIRDNFGHVDGLSISFYAGDFSEIAEKVGHLGEFDIVSAMWFVTSEVLDVTSSAANRKVRQDFYRKIKNVLSKNGVFIEDIPESGQSGFYKISRYFTYEILNKRGILGANPDFPGSSPENINMSLTNIPGKAKPFHIRCLEFNGAHEELLRSVGLFTLDRHTEEIPSDSYFVNADPDLLKIFGKNNNLTYDDLYRRYIGSLKNDVTITGDEKATVKKKTLRILNKGV